MHVWFTSISYEMSVMPILWKRNSFIQQGISSAAPSAWNFLIHSMSFYWECTHISCSNHYSHTELVKSTILWYIMKKSIFSCICYLICKIYLFGISIIAICIFSCWWSHEVIHSNPRPIICNSSQSWEHDNQSFNPGLKLFSPQSFWLEMW